ncbi:MAG: GNAT family N-acetyltransferase [Pseudomonadales bacterium]|nr:GNAT family N-acetyltransferase [Pseudomonadales bacterium]
MSVTERNPRDTIRPIRIEDVEHATRVLAHAFEADPVLRFIIPDDADWQRVSLPWFRSVLRSAVRRESALIDDRGQGVIVWETPAAGAGLARQLLSTIRMTGLLRHNLGRARLLSDTLRSYRPRRAHWYLAYIGIEPGKQRSGLGQALLDSLLERADIARMPVYLECSARGNLGFYNQARFHLVDEVTIPTGVNTWPMLREPNPA